MTKIKYLLFLSLLIGLIVGCTSATIDKNIPAEQVVKDYFKYWNDKDSTKLEEMITPDRRGITWEFDKLEYVKVISITENTSKAQQQSKVFDVVFEIKFKNGSGSGLTDGKHSWSYFLKKDKEGSPWLIHDWGV